MTYVLITTQLDETNGVELTNAYSSPDVNKAELESIAHGLADGASPPMTFVVLPLQPAHFDSL